ncbi:MAG: thrombospondin type 3 repeat-containing protein [Thermoleophilaceae bacterium]
MPHRSPAAALAAVAALALLLAAAPASAAPCRPALFDAEPTLWDFHPALDGAIFDGAHGASGVWRDDAFDGYGQLTVDVAGGGGLTTYGSTGADACTREEGGREVVFPTVSIDGLQVSRKVYSPAAGPGFIRWLDVLHNPGSAPISTAMRFTGNLGTDAAPDPPATAVFATSSGDAVAGPADSWAASDDGGGGDPQIVHVWDDAGPGAADRADVVTLADGDEDVEMRYGGVTIAPGATAAFMHLAALRSTRADATAAAQMLSVGGGMVFFGLSPGEGAALRNWSGLDFDRDGVASESDNCPYSGNPGQEDSNGDGIGDACAGDIDGDGLSNEREALLGTNPALADTDGDSVPDGSDVCAVRAGLGVDGCADTTRPLSTVSRYARRPRRSRLFSRGLTARVGCDEPCSVRVQLIRSSRGVRFSRGGDLIVGERLQGQPQFGRRTVRVKPLRRFRRVLRRGTRLTFRVIVSDVSGNRRTLNRRIVVR